MFLNRAGPRSLLLTTTPGDHRQGPLASCGGTPCYKLRKTKFLLHRQAMNIHVWIQTHVYSTELSFEPTWFLSGATR